MAIIPKSILVGYNKCEALATKWANILDSFRHKDEKIPIEDIEGDFNVELSSAIDSDAEDVGANSKAVKLVNHKIGEVNQSIEEEINTRVLEDLKLDEKITALDVVRTFYLNVSSGDDATAKINETELPFRTFPAIINALDNLVDDGGYYTIFCTTATSNIIAAELPNRNLRFKGQPLGLNFTGVNEGGSVIRSSGTSTPFEYNFEDGNVTLFSNSINVEQTFYHPDLTVIGNIKKFDFKGNDGANVSRAVFTTKKTNLFIDEFKIYKGIGITALTGSIIEIKKLYVEGTAAGITAAINNSSSYIFNQIIFNIPAARFTVSGDSQILVKDLKGTGTLVSNSRLSKYENTTVENGVTISPTAGLHEGNVVSDHYAFYPTSVSSILQFNNFSGKCQNIRIFSNTAKVVLKGNNVFKCSNHFVRVYDEVIDNCITIENGITIIELLDSNLEIFKNHISGTYDLPNMSNKLVESGILHHNSVNAGTIIVTKNKARRWQRIFDDNGFLVLKNTPVYEDNASALAGGLALGTTYRTSNGDKKEVY